MFLYFVENIQVQYWRSNFCPNKYHHKSNITNGRYFWKAFWIFGHLFWYKTPNADCIPLWVSCFHALYWRTNLLVDIMCHRAWFGIFLVLFKNCKVFAWTSVHSNSRVEIKVFRFESNRENYEAVHKWHRKHWWQAPINTIWLSTSNIQKFIKFLCLWYLKSSSELHKPTFKFKFYYRSIK